METHEKIRVLRELNKWSQEEVAAKLDMSSGGYAKIERGESQLSLSRLEQIAKIFNINIFELMKEDKGVTFQVNDIDGSNGNIISVYSTSAELITEIEKLKLALQYKDELLAQQARELQTLQSFVEILKNK